LSGDPYSGGRGGAGNIARGTGNGTSDRVDEINPESLVAGPKEGEGYSTGRGGGGNVHPAGTPLPRAEKSAGQIGLAYGYG
jgi:Protein of unknown function (DUF3602)